MAKLFALILEVLGNFLGWLREGKLLDAGAATKEAEQAKEATNAIVKANEARDAARKSTDGAGSTDELPDDGFRRD